jgi:hypothetical protein
MVSKKIMLNMLLILTGLETVLFSICRCVLQVNVLVREPLSLLTSFRSVI